MLTFALALLLDFVLLVRVTTKIRCCMLVGSLWHPVRKVGVQHLRGRGNTRDSGPLYEAILWSRQISRFGDIQSGFLRSVSPYFNAHHWLVIGSPTLFGRPASYKGGKVAENSFSER